MTVTRALLIGGKEVDALDGGVTDDLDPFTGEVVARVAAAGRADVTRAVDAADAAFAEWSRSDPNDRRRVLLAAADLLEHRGSDIADVMVAETGSIRGWGAFNVGLASGMLREAAGLTTAPIGEVLTTSTPGSMSLALRQPAGVVAAFAPWNAPVILGVRSVAVALAVGNTVVMKPSEEAPLSAALLLADVLGEAGIPDGVVNVITNAPPDAATIAEALISDPRVRRVNFTGSTRVGRIIAQTAALHLKPAVLELGGKNALVILSDADVEYAVDAVSFGAYMNSGQICMSTDRVIVDRSLAAEFTQRLAAKASVLPSGDPRLPTTLIGPLITPDAARRVSSLVSRATAEGARVVAGGGEPDGALYPASVLSDVRPGHEIWSEEIFGPVCTVTEVDGTEAAIAAANDSVYGLTAGVITEDLKAGLEVARRVRTGIVHVNDQTVDDEPQAPFGGVGDSGYGRFGGKAGIDAFTDLRWVTLQQGKKGFPF